MATPQLSPGVLIREVDLTVGRVDNIVDNIGAIAGPFLKGPVEDPVTIETEEELIQVFGKPQSADNQYEYWMTASAFLSYGGIVKVVRTDGDTIVNSSTRTVQEDEILTITATLDPSFPPSPASYCADSARNAGTYVLKQLNAAGEVVGAANTVGYGFTVSTSGDSSTASPGSGAIISVGIGTTGEITAIEVVNPGSGYVNGDVIYINDFILGNPDGDNPIQLVVGPPSGAAKEYDTADDTLKIKNFNDYSGTEGDVVNYVFAGKNPGTWSNGVAIAIIDDKADQILTVGSAVSNITVGCAVTVTLDQVRRPVRRTGRNDEGGGFFSEDGFLKGIVTGVDANAKTVDVKVVSKVSAAGVEEPIEYKNRSRHASFKPNTQIVFTNSNAVGVATVNITQGNQIKDWYDEQIIPLETGNVLWKSIAGKPSTNQWIAERKGRNDALHIAVFDDLGSATGIKGNLLEKFTFLSKAVDTISAVNPPERLFYKDHLALNSKYIFAGANPSDISNNEKVVSSGFYPGTGTFASGLNPVSLADGLWNQPGRERTFSVYGTKIFKLSGGKDYTPVLPATSTDATVQAQITASNNAQTLTVSETTTTGSMKATLGQLLNAYDLFADPDDIAIDYLLMGPGLEEKLESQAKAQNLIAIAEDRKDCIACISPHREDVLPGGASYVSPDDITDNIVEFFSTLSSSSYAVFDSGYKYTYDRFNNTFRYIPCNGDIAGLMVRTSIESYPWFSPAGQQRGILNNAVKLAYNPNKAQRDRLYVARVNPIITQNGLGTLLFGDKTALGYASAFDRINVRRLFLYIEQALQSLANAQLFELNDDITRANFTAIVDPFLAEIQAKRGLYGYLIVCNETNNTPEIIDNNEFRADIFLKPTKSINYVTLTFVATRTGVSFGEVAGTV